MFVTAEAVQSEGRLSGQAQEAVSNILFWFEIEFVPRHGVRLPCCCHAQLILLREIGSPNDGQA
jgi:hypothetical protein